jgi:uncharacterized membrane protein YcaP (DUF421 family)
MNFSEIFSMQVPAAELFVRGTLMYWFIFLMFRFILRREAGGIGMADLLLVVLIADAAQNAMAGEYKTVPEGCVLVATLMGWNFLMDWAGYRFAAVRKLLEPRPLLLIQQGRFLWRNMRREYVTREDVEGELRKKGIGSVEEVERAYLEGDGSFSAVARQPRAAGLPSTRSTPGAGT